MKKIITTVALTLSVIALAQAQECNKGTNTACKPAGEAKLIATRTEGEKTICTWLVKETTADESNEFTVKYRVNASQISDSYAQNDKTLTGAAKFMDGIMKDTLKQISRIEIIGHASPDGPTPENAALAKERASNFCRYITRKFSISKYPCTPTSEAYQWDDIAEAVQKSSVPQKAAVMKILTSNKSQAEIEEQLRAMKASWYYLAKNVLPEFRCVDLHVVYTSWKEVETCSDTAPEMVEEVVLNNYYIIIDEPTSDVIVMENKQAPALDFKRDTKFKYKYKENKHRDKLKEEERTFWGRKKSVIKVEKEE